MDTVNVLEQYTIHYQDEINYHLAAENEFLVLKKDMDAVCMNKVDVDAKVDALTNEINFLKTFYEIELAKLQSQILDMSIMLSMDNSHSLDPHDEAEAWYQIKFETLQVQAGEHEEDLWKELEAILQQAKQDIAWQLCKYQELTDVKMALDIEIPTYPKLPEGEESQLAGDEVGALNISVVNSTGGDGSRLARLVFREAMGSKALSLLSGGRPGTIKSCSIRTSVSIHRSIGK
ncbi:unnamed protein product [Nyctereutes procyonoides]|uniref:(raccoon dog) hypothetical protein n=1 Tax=Nyctereutes procyonoides TaxID=34880 RepID=A0A812A064_NYCPR|nr:unnamed protein product [Nyctereutes procyonoides]